MNRLPALLIVFLTAISAQAKHAVTCAEAQQQRHRHPAAKISSASPFLDLYDVNYVKLDLSMSHLNTDVSGSATTGATVIAGTGMGRYAFELSDKLTIDSVKLNGVRLTPRPRWRRPGSGSGWRPG